MGYPCLATYVEFDATYIDTVNMAILIVTSIAGRAWGLVICVVTILGRASFFSLDKFDEVSLSDSRGIEPKPTQPLGVGQRPYTTREFRGDMGEIFTQHRNLDTLINFDRSELARVKICSRR